MTLKQKVQFWRTIIHSMINPGEVWPHIQWRDWIGVLLAFPCLIMAFTTWFGWGKVLIGYGILFSICTASAYMTGLIGDKVQ